MMENGCQMLVPGKVQGMRFAQGINGKIPSGLGPAIGIKVTVQATTHFAMDVRATAKDGLGKGNFEIRTLPILPPRIEKLQLTRP